MSQIHALRFTFHVSRFTQYALLTLSLLFLGCGGGIKLIDFPKSSVALNLTKEQQEVIKPQIALLQDIVEDYKFEKNELEADYLRYRSNASLSRASRYEGGGLSREIRRERNEMRTKLRGFVTQRREYAKELSGLISEIRANLTPAQLVLFEEIKLPELELPKMLKRRPYDEFGLIPGTRRGRPGDF